MSAFTDKIVDEAALNIGLLTPGEGTKASAKIALTNTAAASANTSTYTEIDWNTTSTMDSQKSIRAYSNEQASFSGEKTARVQIEMYTHSDTLSPVIDIDQSDLLCIKNELNNDSTNEDGRGAGNASSRYISRRVILEEGMDAEDIRVYVDASIPSSCDVKAYAKLQNAADPGDFQEDLSWIELSKIGYPAEQTESFAEYYWQLPSKPASGKNIAGVNGSGIFEYDLDVVDAVSITSGGAGYTSVPTVAVTGGGGFGAQIRAEVSAGSVSALIIENPGREYTSAPTITISGGGASTDATATATIGTITYSGYKTYAVKLVPLGTNTVEVPKLKDLRAIALQA